MMSIKDWCGVDNSKILKLAQYLSNEKNIPLWIRIVYISGITDKKDAFKRYKLFIKNLKSVEKIEVLPYHEMGLYKWKELNINYQLQNIRIPTSDECQKIEHFLST